jgi:GNAT superfamily N-acetyltransferase
VGTVTTIRKATEQDDVAVLECLHETFEPFRDFYSEEGFLDTTLTPETLKERGRSSTIFVAERDGRIVGTIACSRVGADEGHLRGMAVLPEFQGADIAAELLRTAEETIKTWGCSCVTLDTTQPLQRAIRFYEKHGYRRAERVGNFFGMPLYEYRKNL